MLHQQVTPLSEFLTSHPAVLQLSSTGREVTCNGSRKMFRTQKANSKERNQRKAPINTEVFPWSWTYLERSRSKRVVQLPHHLPH